MIRSRTSPKRSRPPYVSKTGLEHIAYHVDKGTQLFGDCTHCQIYLAPVRHGGKWATRVWWGMMYAAFLLRQAQASAVEAPRPSAVEQLVLPDRFRRGHIIDRSADSEGDHGEQAPSDQAPKDIHDLSVA